MFAKGNSRKSFAVVLALMLLVAFAGIAAAYTPAGTQISNQATATYKADGKARSATSNVVYVTVAQIAGVEVGPKAAQDRNVVAGQTVQHVYTVTNTGNATDTFELATVVADGGFTNENAVEWYHDKDANGVINASDPKIGNEGLTLAAGATANVIARFSVPADATTGGGLVLALTAVSGYNDIVNDTSETVTFTVVDEDLVTAVISRDKGEVEQGEEITYTVTVTNQTLAPIQDINVVLSIPVGTDFVDDSLYVQDEKVNPRAWDSTSEPTVVISELGVGGFSSQATIKYTVRVDEDALAGYITNSASGEAGESGTAFATNEVNTLVLATADVAINKKSHVFVQTGAGRTVSIPYTVTNKGNADDLIYVNSVGLGAQGGDRDDASGWTVQLYKSDGVTPLPKQDGKYTVGTLGAGETSDIVVKVTVPVETKDNAGPFEIETTVTSRNDSSKTDSVKARFTQIMGNHFTIEVDDEDTAEANPGETVQYPVIIKNWGPADDVYTLTHEGFPEGAVVEFVDEDGNPITEVPLDDRTAGEVYVRVTVPEGQEPGPMEGNVVGTSQNDPTATEDDTVTIIVKEYVNFTLYPDKHGIVNQGALSLIEFTLRNDGNSAQTFDLPKITGNKLTYQLLDEENNVIEGIAVAKGDSAIVKVRVDADYTVMPGWTESVQVVAEHADGESSSATLTMTVTGTELELDKDANVTEAAPGETITYTVTATNVSLEDLTDVVIYDAIPEHTEFVEAAGAGAISYTVDGTDWDAGANADGITSVKWEIGTLAVGAEVEVTLTVKVK